VEAIEVKSVAATGSKFNDVEKSQLLALIMSFLARSRLFSSASSSSPNANLIWSASPSFPPGCSRESIIIYIRQLYRKTIQERGRKSWQIRQFLQILLLSLQLLHNSPLNSNNKINNRLHHQQPHRLQRRQNQSTTQPYNQTPQTLQQNNTQPSTLYNPQAAVFQPVVPQQRVISQPSRTSTPQQQEHTIIDPATITEWSAGLRCVTKIAAQNPLFAEKIRGVSFWCMINFYLIRN
jgi:hypothetical protein